MNKQSMVQMKPKADLVLMPIDKYFWGAIWMGERQIRNDLAGNRWWIKQVILWKFLLRCCFGDQFGNAEAARKLYFEIFKDSSADAVFYYPEGDADTGKLCSQNLSYEWLVIWLPWTAGQSCLFVNEAVSFVVDCDGRKEEVDSMERNKFISNGGQESQCGWLKDKFGVSWQNCL